MSGKYVFSKGLKELRFLFCQTSEQSAATRHVSFINRAYPTMKKHNPHTPILMREARGTEPRVFARYELGKETQAALSGLSDSQIEERITTLVKQSS
ncbi:NADH-ubiquinone oxidoreductase 10.5 kDa subunit [Penicillium cataractarum]|uniref:NADH-ubiquinone oxidoreductase 10.5 kDa subunit n=1 Tax=Penicillium cataractarum TaxID=2100454 RepID=A0A9W9V6I3_9EURO|nr:NADH-ubiquinone oxidoreductase 10.5 kDa subunit [Penicillium cataractarum]KAJ5368066.1 NADH-ubiquinone oxidoreductase 10.5 kDa subunit [Penicillium cataractarum]